MKKEKGKELAGKWKYTENYGFGTAEGELMLEQEGNTLSGRIIFTEKGDEEEPFMIQEFLTGKIEDLKVSLEAKEFDVIHAEHNIHYELDSFFGIWVDENTIKGISTDEQGVEGNFVFQRIG